MRSHISLLILSIFTFLQVQAQQTEVIVDHPTDYIPFGSKIPGIRLATIEPGKVIGKNYAGEVVFKGNVKDLRFRGKWKFPKENRTITFDRKGYLKKVKSPNLTLKHRKDTCYDVRIENDSVTVKGQLAIFCEGIYGDVDLSDSLRQLNSPEATTPILSVMMLETEVITPVMDDEIDDYTTVIIHTETHELIGEWKVLKGISAPKQKGNWVPPFYRDVFYRSL